MARKIVKGEKTKREEKNIKVKSISSAPKIEKKAKKTKTEKIYNPWKVLKYPHLAEKSMNMIEFENKLVFIVNFKSNRTKIKEAIERGFDVKVENVNVEITRKGLKKAYIKLKPEFVAADVASRLGML